jgi:hypothetical protein
MVRCVLLEVTVHGGLIALAYVFQCLRHRYLQLTDYLSHPGGIHSPEHACFTDRTDSNQISQSRGLGLVNDRISPRAPSFTASQTVQLPGLQRPLVGLAPRKEEGDEILSMDQLRSALIDHPEPFADPFADRIPMVSKQVGDLLDAIGEVLLRQSMVGVTYSHGSPPRAAQGGTGA